MDESRVQLFYSVTKEICELIDLIKCPICLDIFKDPVIIKCKHTFCTHCLDNSLTGLRKNGSCPICRSTINRRDKYPNTSVSSLLKFIENVTEGLKENLSVDLISDLYIRNFLTKHKTIDINNLHSTKQVKVAPKKDKKSLRDNDPIEEFLEIQNKNIASTSKQLNIASNDYIDPFDKLLGKPTINKNIRTYRPKRKEIDKDDGVEILEFEDAEQKLKIIKWLTDSQNEFERLTQTQQELEEDDEVQVDENLHSISQSVMQKRKTRRLSRKGLNNNERRFRSLDIQVTKNTQNIKRHSLGHELKAKEIENEKIIQIMEEDCLNRYEDQFIKNKDKSQSSRWKKIPKDVKKSINKSEHKQKKLKISVGKQKESRKVNINPIVNLTDMETFFNEKMLEKDNVKDTQIIKTKSVEKINIQLNKNDVTEQESQLIAFKNVEENNLHTVIKPESKIKDSKNVEENKIHAVIEPESKIKKSKNVEENKIHAVIEPETQIKTKNVEEINIQIKNDSIDLNNKNNTNNTSNNSNDDIFMLPTQDLLTNERLLRNEEDDNLLSYIEHFEKIKDILTKRKKYRKLLPAIQKLQPTMQQLKIFLNTGVYQNDQINSETQTETINCIDGFSQTIQPIYVEKFMQTLSPVCIDNSIQTEVDTGFYISTNDAFKTQKFEDKAIQTENTNIEQNINDNCILSRSMDNLVIETQVILNKYKDDDCESHKELSPPNVEDFSTQFSMAITSVNRKRKSQTEVTPLILNNDDFKTQFTVSDNNMINCATNTNSSKTQRISPLMLNDDDFQTQFTESGNNFPINKKSGKIKETPLNFDDFQTQFTESDNNNKAKTSKEVTPPILNNDDFQTQFTESNKYLRQTKEITPLNSDDFKTQFTDNSDSSVNLIKKQNIQKETSPPILNNEDFQTQFSEANSEHSRKEIISPDLIDVDYKVATNNLPTISNATKSKTPNSSDQINNLNRMLITRSEEQSLMNVCDELKLSIPKTNEQIDLSTHSSLGNSNIVISVDLPKPKINRRLSYSEKNKFKRIRVNSDSDSDDDKRKKKKLENKFMRSDVSVCFDTQNEKLNEIPSIGGSDLSMDYVDQVWNKIDQGLLGVELVEPKKDIVKPHQQEAKMSEERTQDMLLKYDKMISEANKKYTDVTEEKIVESLFTTSKPDKNISDNNFSESLFGDSKIETCVLNPNKSSFDAVLADFNKPDDDDMVLLNLINSPKKINILQNIAVESKIPVIDNIISEEEMFYSDDDIIEDTPEKLPQNRIRTKSSSSNTAVNNVQLQEIEQLEELDGGERTITPPPQFQDDNIDTDDDAMDITITNTATEVKVELSVNNSEQVISLSPISRDNSKTRINVVTPKPCTSALKKYTSTPKSGHKQTSIRNFMRKPLKPVQENVDLFQDWKKSVRKPCIACTRLVKEQMMKITALTNKRLASYVTVFNESVTHMVVNTNENNRVHDHTIKYVSAVAAGIWVVNFKWIQDCIKQNCIISEEPYEVLDYSGIAGPKESRLNRLKKPLFKGFKIHAAPPFLASTQKELENIITLLGGVVVKKLEEFRRNDGHICLIITESKATEELEDFQALMESNGFKVMIVDIEWLSRSVSQYKLQNLRRFALCTNDYICEIESGYPIDLMKNVSCTPTQSSILN